MFNKIFNFFKLNKNKLCKSKFNFNFWIVNISNSFKKAYPSYKFLVIVIPIYMSLLGIYSIYSYNNQVKELNTKLISLEKEYLNIMNKNPLIQEFEKYKSELNLLSVELELWNKKLKEFKELYDWDLLNQDLISKTFGGNSFIFLKDDKELLLYGNDDFLTILNGLKMFEKKYPKYNINFVKYNGYDKSFKIKILNIQEN